MAAPEIPVMNSRRLTGFSPLAENHLRESLIRPSSESYAPHRSRTGKLMSALGHKRPIFHVAMALQNGRYTPESDQKLAISDRPPPANYASSRCLIFWSLWGEEQTFAAMSEMTLCANSGLMQCSKRLSLFDHFVGARQE
jgi:hypothetical protein